MKLTYLLSLLAAAVFFAGCASTESTSYESAPESASESAPEAKTAKTAYEGSTGSGLLMERYKTGAIEGYRE